MYITIIKLRCISAPKSWSHIYKEYCCFDHSNFPVHSMFTFDVCWGSLSTSIFRNSSSAASSTRSRLRSRLSFRFLWLCTYEELRTILHEIEIILNNRPLTFTYKNPNDPVLTPNQLLFDRRLNFQVIDSKEEETIDICSRYKYIQDLIDHFIKRWENK